MKVTAIQCDWKDAFSAEDLNRAIKDFGSKIVFHDCPDAMGVVDAHVLIIADRKLTEAQISMLWESIDLYLCEDVFEGRTFKQLFKAACKYANEQDN